MRFDDTITLGTVLHLCGTLIALAFAFSRVMARMERHGEIIAEMKAEIHALRNDLMRGIEERVRKLEILVGSK